MKIGNQYIIQFKTLKEGRHSFDFVLDRQFFEAFEQLEVPDGQVEAGVWLNKKSSFMELEVSLKGIIQVRCDRCLDYMDFTVDYSDNLVVRFSENPPEEDDEIIYLHPDDHLLDLKHFFYESISLSIPMRKVHGDDAGSGGCNRDMLEWLRQYGTGGE